MKLKRILASALAIATIMTVGAVSAMAASTDYEYVYNFDHMLDFWTVTEGDAKVFQTGSRGTAEASGIFGGNTEYSPGYYTKKCATDWIDYVDDTITWTLKDGTLVISGDGYVAAAANEPGPFYDNPYIRTVIIEKDVKLVGDRVLSGIPNLETIFVMNANTMLDTAVLEAPKLKAIVYGAGLNDEQFFDHAMLMPGAITDDCEIIVLSKNYVTNAGWGSAGVKDNTVRSDLNLFVYDDSGVHLPVTSNGAAIQANVDGNRSAQSAVNTYAKHPSKMSYNDLLAYVRTFTGNLPQTARNMLPTALTTGSTANKPTVSNQVSGWAASDVTEAQSLGIVPKTLPANFTQNITRQQFCEIIAPLYEKLSGQTITERVYYGDTNNESVEKLAGIGIVGGIEWNRFAPDKLLTRAEASAIFVRMCNKLGVSVPATGSSFADCANHWARNEIQTCTAIGLMQGSSATTFNPDGNLTIEQAIVIALRAYKKL